MNTTFRFLFGETAGEAAREADEEADKATHARKIRKSLFIVPTPIPHIFTAGDMRRGQSLIVWAISEGREGAREVDLFLMGYTNLPTKGNGDLPSL